MKALESVSKEAVRMREIKDDLTTVLRRLQEEEQRSTTAAEPPEPRFGGRDGEVGGGNDEAPTGRRAAYGEGDAVPLEEEKLDRFSTRQAERTVRFFLLLSLANQNMELPRTINSNNTSHTLTT